jgi:hypothetical protein
MDRVTIEGVSTIRYRQLPIGPGAPPHRLATAKAGSARVAREPERRRRSEGGLVTMTIGDAVLLWLLGGLAGSMLFFAVVVAPTVFRALPPDQAGRFLRAFFPRYYAWGVVLGGAATAMGASSGWLPFLACATVAVLFLYARQVLMPKINAARDAQLGGAGEAGVRFDRLHRRSVLVNALQLLLLLAAAAWFLGSS